MHSLAPGSLAEAARGPDGMDGTNGMNGWGAPAKDITLSTLQRERDAAEAASAAKSRYLANVSHEIRSPLNAIYGYAQLLERGSAIDTVEAARVIRRSAEHLNDLVEGLLDISLVENGIMRVSTDTVRLPSFIDQVGRMFRPAAEAKGLTFRTEIIGRLPDYVRADQKRLRQALINLISNAIKYTQAGEVVLVVRYAAQIATFEVRDTGPGIAPESQEAIFAPFDRGVEGARAGGIGLGLPITRAIIQILGGELELESVPGQGSCFRVRVMLGQVVGHRDGPGEGVGGARRVATGYAGPRRSILAADDDPRQLSFVRQVLGDLGFDVVAVADGETALAMARAQRFDLALLDIAMPGWSGWETAAALRKLGGNDMRIVMLSANAHERHGQADPTDDAAHDRFLVKPVDIDTLADTIGELLGLTWTFASATAQAVPAEPKVGAIAAKSERDDLPDAALVHLDRLRERVRIGHVRGIEAEIRAVEAIVGKDCAFVSKLYDCLDRFDLSGLARMLEKA
ncbi:ATP-binding protein [Novosphingobium sp. Fuku2-ISO-50]|uniref:ATP-binding response regulator n=1 Tax=Novosphingobium sp. Fuku2-ISO-50 TaxID=1739114 RepID=UPI001E65B58A|nr:ATP-binding protein [Novosphingobium sp. Fuku2-ISO-50]